MPQGKKRRALSRKLKETFRRFRSQPVSKVIEEINPILRGWVNYFAIGNSSRCFSYIRHWWKRRFGDTWPEPDSAQVSAGSGGVVDGFINSLDSLIIIESDATFDRRKRPQRDRSHNP